MKRVIKQTSLDNRYGFTILEVIIVVAIFGVMAAITLPLLKSTTKNADLRSAAQELYGQFQRAKSEAIKQNQPVEIIFDAVIHGKWYRIYVDSNNNNTQDSGEQVLSDVTLPNGVEFSPAVNFGGNNLTGFTNQGRPSGGTGSAVLTNISTGKIFTLTTSIAGYISLQ